MATVEKFANTLSSEVKSDSKKIEEAFKTYCKTTPENSKENKFVRDKSVYLMVVMEIYNNNNNNFFFSVTI